MIEKKDNKKKKEYPEDILLQPIAHIHSAFTEKFGIPRQSGLVPALQAEIVFAPAYRVAEALRGIEEFSHLWLIWEFSRAYAETWSPTVRPPRLGGNVRKGVFATRSPFRPNPIGLSCVKLEGIEWDTPQGAVLKVSGADLLDGTPIYDIKPYLPYADSHPGAVGGFADAHVREELEVVFPEIWEQKVPVNLREGLKGVLAQDPRPAYQNDPDRVYGFGFADLEVRFTVREQVLTVCEIRENKS